MNDDALSPRKPAPGNYDIRELPTIDDPWIREFGFRLQEVRNIAVDLSRTAVLGVVRRSKLMVYSVVQRMAECSLSIEILASKGRVRDAAVLILTLFELRVDLQYIAQDAQRETEWLEQAETRRKRWSVSSQLKHLYPNEKERELEAWFYEQCSMVKHGNPAGGQISFAASVEPGHLVLGKENFDLLRGYLFAAASNLSQAFQAALQILRRHGCDVEAHVSRMQKCTASLDIVFEESIKEILLRQADALGNAGKMKDPG